MTSESSLAVSKALIYISKFPFHSSIFNTVTHYTGRKLESKSLVVFKKS